MGLTRWLPQDLYKTASPRARAEVASSFAR